MAISVNWNTKVITVPKADMTLIQTDPFEVRELNANDFRMDLKGIEESEEGMPYPDTHKHNTETVLSGVTFARIIEIIHGYTVTFEDGQYAVNIVGGNNNIADVVNLNQVSVRPSNSAGLVSGAGVTENDKEDIAEKILDKSIYEHRDDNSLGETLRKLLWRSK